MGASHLKRRQKKGQATRIRSRVQERQPGAGAPGNKQLCSCQEDYPVFMKDEVILTGDREGSVLPVCLLPFNKGRAAKPL